MTHETWRYYFSSFARTCDLSGLFWIADFVRSTKNRNKPANGNRYCCAREKASETRTKGSAASETRTGTGTNQAITAITTTHFFGTSAATPVQSCARSKTYPAVTKSQTEAKKSRKAQEAKSETRGARGAKTKAETASTRRFSKVTQRFNEAKKVATKTYTKGFTDHKAKTNCRSARVRTSSGGERTLKEGSAANCTLLEYPGWGEGCAKNAN